MEKEFLEGELIESPCFRYTKNSSVAFCRVSTDNGFIKVVAWNDLSEKLNELNKGDKLIVNGYRKYNDFLKLEEFIISYFAKRFFKGQLNEKIDY
jgi:single-stranded DNA-binding protein